jgi:4-hydroxy-2-oxoheptanedioate aldolase
MNRLKLHLQTVKPSFIAWTDAGSAAICEMMARQGAPAIVVDAQHGKSIEAKADQFISGITKHGVAPIVRIPVGRYDMASYMLDMGALGIIAPMINRASDALHFVEFVKYPPIGQRSYGPSVASAQYGLDNNAYAQRANDNVVAIAMVETREAVNNLSSILDIKGLDAILVGPSDLDVSLTNSMPPNPFGTRSLGVIEDIAKEVRASGKISGIYCSNLEHAAIAQEIGYDFICVGSADSYMRDGLSHYMNKFSIE